MADADSLADRAALEAFVGLVGERHWQAHMADIARLARSGPRSGREALTRHGAELVLARLRLARTASPLEQRLAGFIGELARLRDSLPGPARARLRAALRAGLTGGQTLVPLLHLARVAALHRQRGYEVRFSGFADGTAHDLEVAHDGVTAEIACATVSAEAGRGVHRGAWFTLADRVDPDLQTWLAAHPGRYLLKITLPDGLAAGAALPALHERIRRMLAEQKRADQSDSAVLRLDPLLIAGAQAGEAALLPRLRAQFGEEAHLAVTVAGESVFVLAARAGRENEVAAAVRRDLSALAPARLSGTRPGILAVLVEDTDRAEWRLLRERLALEGEVRHFFTRPEAKPVVAVSCSSRLELFGLGGEDAAPGGELRYRNHAHPAANLPPLAAAVASSK